MTNYYTILGVANYASIQEVKEAYKAKIKLYHPDINIAPDAEEISKHLNLAKEYLGTAEAKDAYDQKLKLAYLLEKQRIARTHQETKLTTNLHKRMQRSKEARKWRIKIRYENSLKYLSKPFRLWGCVLLTLWGLQLIYSHYFFYYGSLDRLLVFIGVGIFFLGASLGASEVYTRFVIRSIAQKVPNNFEQKIGITYVSVFLLGLGMVAGLNEYRANYHLTHHSAYTTATIDFAASLYGQTVVRYEINKKVYFKKLNVDLRKIVRLKDGKTIVKYAEVNPLICTGATSEEARDFLLAW